MKIFIRTNTLLFKFFELIFLWKLSRYLLFFIVLLWVIIVVRWQLTSSTVICYWLVDCWRLPVFSKLRKVLFFEIVRWWLMGFYHLSVYNCWCCTYPCFWKCLYGTIFEWKKATNSPNHSVIIILTCNITQSVHIWATNRQRNYMKWLTFLFQSTTLLILNISITWRVSSADTCRETVKI